MRIINCINYLNFLPWSNPNTNTALPYHTASTFARWDIQNSLHHQRVSVNWNWLCSFRWGRCTPYKQKWSRRLPDLWALMYPNTNIPFRRCMAKRFFPQHMGRRLHRLRSGLCIDGLDWGSWSKLRFHRGVVGLSCDCFVWVGLAV